MADYNIGSGVEGRPANTTVFGGYPGNTVAFGGRVPKSVDNVIGEWFSCSIPQAKSLAGPSIARAVGGQ